MPERDLTVLGPGGRFVVQRRLGSGAFGVVYAARDRTTGKVVAVKLLQALDAPAADAVAHEVRLLSAVRHPNVVQVHGLYEDDDDRLLVMELVDGVDFVKFVRSDQLGSAPSHRPRALRSEQPPRSLPTAFGQGVQEPGTSAYAACSAAGLLRLRKTLPQLVAGLAAIHSAGVVHRDVRPANVRVTPSGRVVLLDFGLALARDESASSSDAVGTPAYMAPEQWDAASAGPAADWYGVGVLLFEALTGALPFSGSAQEMWVRKRTISAPRPSSVVGGSTLASDVPGASRVPADLDELCSTLLHAAPEHRLRAAEELAAAEIDAQH